jgi:hypothetical protein
MNPDYIQDLVVSKCKANLVFHKLNVGWNADADVPQVQIAIEGAVLWLKFNPNRVQFPDFRNISLLYVRFNACSRYRVTPVNDHGWYADQCRFSGVAPDWGEFYEITGDTCDELDPRIWVNVDSGKLPQRHFHFYFRDEAVEVKAADFELILDGKSYEKPLEYFDV